MSHRHLSRASLACVLLCACAPKQPSVETMAKDLPRLVAPEGEVYAVHLGTSPDPAVAALAEGLPWEETLSGAAGSLALGELDRRGAEPWRARWAGYRAGYPHGLRYLEVHRCSVGCLPRELVRTAAQEIEGPDGGDHVGLARARGGTTDVWVLLVGEQDVDLDPVPRSLDTGQRLEVSAGDESDLLVRFVTPGGRLLERAGEKTGVDLLESGEWWVELLRGGETLAAFPVYAGISPVPVPPLDGLTLPATDPDATVAAAWELLDAVREEYQWARVKRDHILQAAARARTRQPEAPIPEPVRPPQGCRATLTCTVGAGEPVEGCFQDWLVDGATRGLLLSPVCAHGGVAATRQDGSVTLVVELGSD